MPSCVGPRLEETSGPLPGPARPLTQPDHRLAGGPAESWGHAFSLYTDSPGSSVLAHLMYFPTLTELTSGLKSLVGVERPGHFVFMVGSQGQRGHLTEKACPPVLCCLRHLSLRCLPSPLAHGDKALEVADETELGCHIFIGSPCWGSVYLTDVVVGLHSFAVVITI